MTNLVIRPWQATGAAAMDSLLDPEPDPYWLTQRQGCHGISARADRFAITLVAEGNSGVIGAATLYENLYHPGRYPATVEVAPSRRREGIGRQLLAALAEHRPESLPLESKIRDANKAAMAFGSAVGMRTYQHCPVPSLDPLDQAIWHWAADQSRPAGARILALGEIQDQQAIEAMVEQYQWVHADWSPMGDRDRIARLWTDYVKDADPRLSSLAIVDQQVVAMNFIWVEDDQAEAVAETTVRDQPYGTELVAACTAQSLTQLKRVGIAAIEFDGHDDDPHLVPVINSMPAVHRNPVSLVEFSP